MVIENSLVIHCVHCPDYDPGNTHDLVATAFTHRPFHSHEPGHGADGSPADLEDTELETQHQDECIAALKPIRTDELRTSKSSDPCSASLQVLFGSLLGAMAYSLLTQMIYEQFMKTQPSQRQSLVKILMTALMVRQVGATDDGLIVRSEQVPSIFYAMISSSLYLKLLMTFTVMAIGVLGTWSLTVKMLACHRHQALHEFV